MKKRLLSFALALVLCLGLTVPASAATMTEIVSTETFHSFLNGYRSSIQGFSEGITWHGADRHGGAFDTNGNIIVPSGTYWDAMKFSDGVSWARINYDFFAVDNTGKELFTLSSDFVGNYNSLHDFHDGLARVESKTEKGKYGYVDKTGKLVIPCQYDSRAGDFHDGLAVVYDSANAFYGYIDKTGKLAIPYQYAEAGEFTNGFAKVKLGNRWTYIDTTGKDLLPQEYSCEFRVNNSTLSTSAQAMSVFGGSDRAFFNKSGQLVSGGYDEVQAYSDGMARVKKDGKSGYVNEAGALAIPCQFDSAEDFKDGYAVVKSGDSYSIIDKTGQVTGTCAKYAPNIGNGCFRFSSSESGRTRWGLIDYTGREIVSPKYNEIGKEGVFFSDGVVPVKNFDNKWGFVDTTGAEIVPCQYSTVVYTGEPGIFEAWDGDKACLLKSSGWTAPATPAAPSVPAAPSAPSGVTANPNSSTVLVNGKNVAFDAYTIDGSNYFKLRDLAYTLNGTEKQFEVGWDNASKTITLTSGSAYTSNGSEMAKGSGAKSASVSASKLLIDGKEVSLTAYSIDGNNYFKLRDIGQAFGFGIGWDNASKTITIDTSVGYTA